MKASTEFATRAREGATGGTPGLERGVSDHQWDGAFTFPVSGAISPPASREADVPIAKMTRIAECARWLHRGFSCVFVAIK
ncbi:MAG: hypothetical protein JW395_0657 [Nitrospira sp.]|nr:hypothetical protein [Nitrospira sp.]